MKPKYKLLKTILLLASPFILNYFIMYQKYNKYQDDLVLQSQYATFHEVPSKLNIVLLILSISVLIYVILMWISKSKEEELLKRGYKEEVNNILNLYKQGVLSKSEVETKFTEMLRNDLGNKQRRKYREAENARVTQFQNTLTDLENLRNKDVLTEKEYRTKVANLNLDFNPDFISVEILNDLIADYNFQNEEKLMTEKYNPPMNERTNDKLLKIIQAEKGNYNESAVYQAYQELLKRVKS